MIEDQAKQATPHSVLLAELLDPNAPKSEREHAAVREIERLTAAHDWQYKMAGDRLRRVEKLEAEVKALLARVTELESANAGLATEAQRVKAGLRFYANRMHFNFGDATDWDDVSGEAPNILCDERGTTIENGTIAKYVLLGRDAELGEDWPPRELPEEIGEENIDATREGK